MDKHKTDAIDDEGKEIPESLQSQQEVSVAPKLSVDIAHERMAVNDAQNGAQIESLPDSPCDEDQTITGVNQPITKVLKPQDSSDRQTSSFSSESDIDDDFVVIEDVSMAQHVPQQSIRVNNNNIEESLHTTYEPISNRNAISNIPSNVDDAESFVALHTNESSAIEYELADASNEGGSVDSYTSKTNAGQGMETFK